MTRLRVRSRAPWATTWLLLAAAASTVWSSLRSLDGALGDDTFLGGPSRSHRRCHRLGRPRRAAAIGAATDVKHAALEAGVAALVGVEGEVGYNLLPESAYEEFVAGAATAMRKAATAAGAAAVGGEEVFSEEDVGYNLLFETAHEEFDDRRVTASHPFPPYVKGSFVIPSLGQFEMGDRRFVVFVGQLRQAAKVRDRW
mmetsp:Transcript_33908/g.97397  ORF Transcript_33908/g.97397 Transcript_33908/m.97397 type:complete len:199 (+) Transcript_33908:31-627(+)